jgi:hypothetical protein
VSARIDGAGPKFTAADAMYGEPHGRFRAWLRQQIGRVDPVGDIARDVFQDRCLGQRRTPTAIYVHMGACHNVSAEAREAYRDAVAEWRA